MEDTNPGGAAQVPMHPSRLENSSPEIVLEFVYGSIAVLEKYGWLILFGVILVWYLVKKLKPMFDKWQSELKEYHDKKNEDPNKIYRQQETVEMARKRMQDKIDADAARLREKQEELEAQRRREKIEDWDRHRLGQGYRSKVKKPDADNESQMMTNPKPKFKKSHPTK